MKRKIENMVLCVCLCGIIKTIPGFYPQFLAELQKPLEFPETGVFCYANEVTLGGPPEIFQTRAGHQKAHTECWNFVNLRCTMCRFDTFIYCKMITTRLPPGC